MSSKKLNVALVGNPNTGKTSLFNQLTGLTQKVGNYPGITVDKKQGTCNLLDGSSAIITDLPGTYSINPTSLDESIVLETLLNNEGKEYPDLVIVVAEVENLKRNLLLFTQVKDLKIPTILVINMVDQMERKGISLDVAKLESILKTKIVLTSARKKDGIENVKEAISKYTECDVNPLFSISEKIDEAYFKEVKSSLRGFSLYKSWLLITQKNHVSFISEASKHIIDKFKVDREKLKKYQHKETIYRYQYINEVLKKTYSIDRTNGTDLRSTLDKVLTHKIFGYVIFTSILLLMFQSVFDWASVPMDYIDVFFSDLSAWSKENLPEGVFYDLFSEGIIPGIGGIVIFIPQIAILFLFVAVLEETGYMSRVVFLMDKIMRRFGMSGKSVIPLISGTACAIPAIMATRNIGGWKDRLITILVTPFTTCSARLPVYAIIIALIIPEGRVLGVFSLQGLVLMALYALGFASAIISAYILNKVLKVDSKNFFIVEMPNYKLPSLKNIFFDVIEKTKAFVLGAGKIILAISIVLWFLASNGTDDFQNAEKIIAEKSVGKNLNQDDLESEIASYKLENSYIGVMGKIIEPAISPLGYDWKIGIALISSFAAREVFVGTLSTIYSVGSDDEGTIKQRMAAEVNPDTGEKRFNFPAGMSLLVFYAFAMQCMGTLAIVKRETKSWKWPVFQLVGMGLLAYVSALITFTILK
ncbi:ferrous iron transport protein B [Flavicella sp.]|uniref:ferrous iron transport protein B n=1 Tax=Flavicella sp. TaxID=2957742 RepID=UPI00262407DC|nr:ferrous iron transport protein B [Flavicella sp.]MDG1804548.1 ferrous iron transport protein B [Flavicella sp.]